MRSLNTWERNYCGSDDPEQIKAIFAKRHKISVILLLVGLAPFFLLPVVFDQLGIPRNGAIVEFVIICQAFQMIGTISYIMLRYRCPRCNAVPNSCQPGTSGILLFPRGCAKCGAPLLPDHRWAQE
jgi:hypothetical protein